LAKTDAAQSTQPPASEAGTFEHSLAELESIVHQLEDGQLGLAEALARYEQGVKHLKHCYQLLQQAERKIDLLTGVADNGMPVTQSFATDASPLEESAGRRRSRTVGDAIDGPPSGT
jgi:exodeoxyribonuclease VII small subunit